MKRMMKMEEVTITLEHPVSIDVFKKVLPKKFNLFEKPNNNSTHKITSIFEKGQGVSKAKQLQPLFIIFFYLTTVVIFLNYKDWDLRRMMFDFMGLFFIVFSFFKFLDAISIIRLIDLSIGSIVSHYIIWIRI